jgi:hypothetical protein
LRDNERDGTHDAIANVARAARRHGRLLRRSIVSRHHRHSRAHTRYHFIRVALKRRRAFLALHPEWMHELDYDLSLGLFDDEQRYMGCHRARCGLCRPGKRWHRSADRAAAEREWRREWGW